MRLTQIKSILLLLLASVLYQSCSDNAIPSETIVMGDRQSVFGYFRFEDIDIPLTSETDTNGWNSKNYSTLLDLNEDGSYDINLFYNQLVGIKGNEINYTAITKFNRSFEVVGESWVEDGVERWVPILFESGFSIELNNYSLGLDQGETYISYSNSENPDDPTNFNSFPVPESKAYLIFKLKALNNREIMGWLHIEQLEGLKGIKILDVGYKYIN